MKRRLAVLAALSTLVVAALASTAGTSAAATDASQAVSCKKQLKIAIITPLTGGAGFLGQEQLSWAKFAIKDLAKNQLNRFSRRLAALLRDRS